MIGHRHRHRPLVPDASVHVHLLLGERRIVVQRIVNDSEEAIVFEPGLRSVVDVTTGANVAFDPVSVSPAGPVGLAPGESVDLVFAIDGTGLATRHVYRMEVSFDGTFVAPLVFGLVVDRPEPIVARHDPSRIRAWIRSHCLEHEPLRWIAPATRSVHGFHRIHGCDDAAPHLP